MSDNGEYTITIPNETMGSFGIEGLPAQVEAHKGAYPDSIMFEILAANLREAFARIDALQREVDALKGQATEAHRDR